MKGSFCPEISGIDLEGEFIRVPCQEHDCEYYQKYEGRDNENNRVDKWDCANKWHTELEANIVRRLLGVQSAVELQTNEVLKGNMRLLQVATGEIQTLEVQDLKLVDKK